ncbi:hypothetical protein EPN83_00260 [Patescibacteria group bacterium]|nr:MAG: hypothetical protein EPN83_00260 [Patescibacteria group bacterium]
MPKWLLLPIGIVFVLVADARRPSVAIIPRVACGAVDTVVIKVDTVITARQESHNSPGETTKKQIVVTDISFTGGRTMRFYGTHDLPVQRGQFVVLYYTGNTRSRYGASLLRHAGPFGSALYCITNNLDYKEV